MSYDNKITTGYFYSAYGWIPSTAVQLNDLTTIQNNILSLEATVDNITDNIIITPNSITLGNGNPNTSTYINTENLALGQYALLNRLNPTTSSNQEAGLILNVTVSSPTLYYPTGIFIPGSSSISAIAINATVQLNSANGLIANSYVAVRNSVQNDGVYRVVSHTSNILTVAGQLTNTDDYCLNNFVAELGDSNIKIYACTVSVFRATNNTDSLEWSSGSTSPLSFKSILYDSKASGELGNIELTDSESQILSNKVTLSIETPSFPDIIERNISIPLTTFDSPDDEVCLIDLAQELKNKNITDVSNIIRANKLAHIGGNLDISGYTAPTNGQMLTKGSWKTPINLGAGNCITLNGSKSNIDTGNVSVAFKAQEQDPTQAQEELQSTPATNNPPFPGATLPNIPSLP